MNLCMLHARTYAMCTYVTVFSALRVHEHEQCMGPCERDAHFQTPSSLNTGKSSGLNAQRIEKRHLYIPAVLSTLVRTCVPTHA